jgi:hypothetical protein
MNRYQNKSMLLLLMLFFAGSIDCMAPGGVDGGRAMSITRTRKFFATAAAAGITSLSSYIFYKGFSHFAQKVFVKTIENTIDKKLCPRSATAILVTGVTMYFVGLPLMHYAYSKLIGKPGYFVDKMHEALQGYIATWVTLKIVQLYFSKLVHAFDAKRTLNSVDRKTVTHDHLDQTKHTSHEQKDDAARIVEELEIRAEALRIDELIITYASHIKKTIAFCEKYHHPIKAEDSLWLTLNGVLTNEGAYDYNTLAFYPGGEGSRIDVDNGTIQNQFKKVSDGLSEEYKIWKLEPAYDRWVGMKKSVWLGDSHALLHGINHRIVADCTKFVSTVHDLVTRKTAESTFAHAERTVLPLLTSITHDCQKALELYKSRITTYRLMAALP